MDSKDAIINIDGTNTKRVVIEEKEVESSKPSGQTIRPRMPRRTTTGIKNVFEGDNLTNFGRALYKLLENPVVRYALYILPVGGILAIPLVLFATKWRHSKIDGISMVGLFTWIEVLWVSLWISKLIAAAVPYLFQGLCGLVSTGVRKYALVLRAVEIPLSLFIWTILGLGEFPIVYIFDQDYYNKNFNLPKTNPNRLEWLHILSNVLKGSIGASALWLALKMLMQLISVSYHGKQYKDKIKEVKLISKAVDLLYEASLKRFEDHHPDFLEEDYVIHDTTNVQKLLKQYSADKTTMRIFGDIHYYGERLVSIFGRMASDVTGTQVFRPTATHAIVESALERRTGAEALARRIHKSFVKPPATCIYESDIVEELGAGSEAESAFIFSALDRDNNGDVSLDEMVLLLTDISRTRKDMWKSACDIKEAIKVLDRVLSVIVLLVIACIYSAFFSNFIAANWTKILGILSAGAFSFGQTVGEFNAACILVFVKHPFDVGDRVNVNNTEYEVVRISLLYTVFKSVATDTIVQVANQVVGNLWVDNVSRSKAMKERLTFAVSPGTKFQDIETLRAELQAFVCAPENCRDYQPEVDIQLLSVGDLKQLDLRVEIKHKSNWANDQLRAYRRSKFMCALLSAMRKVPIDGPAGGGPAQGSINSPNYSVSITDELAKESKKHFDEDKEAKRLVPTATVIPGVNEVVRSTGLEILPSHRGGGAGVVEGASVVMRRPSHITSGWGPAAFGLQNSRQTRR